MIGLKDIDKMSSSRFGLRWKRELWGFEYPIADFESQQNNTMTLGFDRIVERPFHRGPRLWLTMTHLGPHPGL